MATTQLKLSDLQLKMGQSNLQGTILHHSSLLMFDHPVAKNGTVAFETSLTTKKFPLLISSPLDRTELSRETLNELKQN